MTHRIGKTYRLRRVVVLGVLGLASSAEAEQHVQTIPEIFEDPVFKQQVVLQDDALEEIQGRYIPERQVRRVGEVILWDERPGHDAGGIDHGGQARLMKGSGNQQRNHISSQR